MKSKYRGFYRYRYKLVRSPSTLELLYKCSPAIHSIIAPIVQAHYPQAVGFQCRWEERYNLELFDQNHVRLGVIKVGPLIPAYKKAKKAYNVAR